MLRSLACLISLIFCSWAYAFDLSGAWEGDLKTPVGDLRLVLHVSESDSGYSASLDSPDQGARGLPIDEISFKDDKLRFSSKLLKLSFRGSVDGGRIVGRVKQNGQRMSLALTRAKMVEVARPQNPIPPYPYEIEDIALKFADGRILAGTLVLPAEIRTSVILISGSGQQDRDSTVMQHRLFLVLADHLARMGIASFRYDDRGVGESTGDVLLATSVDFAGDLKPVVGYLRQRLSTDLGIIGHSDGASIGAQVAVDAEIEFLVTLAGPTINGIQLLDAQNRALFAGADEANIEKRFEILNTVNQMVVTDQADELDDYLKSAYRGLSKSELTALGLPANRKQLVQAASVPWMKHFLQYEPRDILAQLDIPVLAIFGGTDLQVPAALNSEGLSGSLRHAASQIKTFEGKNHLLQTESSGQPSQYFHTEETMSPEVMEFVGQWLLAVRNESTRASIQ